MPRSRTAEAGRSSRSATRSRRGSPAPTFRRPARSTRCMRPDIAPSAWSGARRRPRRTSPATRMSASSATCSPRLQKAGPVDGVYLDLHGAMVTEHLDDGEGELLARVRKVVGRRVPVVASLDLHANMTRGDDRALRTGSTPTARIRTSTWRRPARAPHGCWIARSRPAHPWPRRCVRSTSSRDSRRSARSSSQARACMNYWRASEREHDVVAVLHAGLSDGGFSRMRDGRVRLRSRRAERACGRRCARERRARCGTRLRDGVSSSRTPPSRARCSAENPARRW